MGLPPSARSPLVCGNHYLVSLMRKLYIAAFPLARHAYPND
ncbi:MAG: hypothetical protein ACD_23C00852G0004 [uncultured bacterium]|nr:MAG: hypothetical protein ACD_23C00852G0004 [uncultured bacterium]